MTLTWLIFKMIEMVSLVLRIGHLKEIFLVLLRSYANC